MGSFAFVIWASLVALVLCSATSYAAEGGKIKSFVAEGTPLQAQEIDNLAETEPLAAEHAHVRFVGDKLQKDTHLPEVSCRHCLSITKTIVDASNVLRAINITSKDKMQKDIEAVCKSMYPAGLSPTGTTGNRDICLMYVKTIMDNVHKVLTDPEDRDLGYPGWNIPRVLCAVYLDAPCNLPCCSSKTPHKPHEVMLNPPDSTDFTVMKVSWVTLREVTSPYVAYRKASSRSDDDWHRVPATVTADFHVGNWLGVIYAATMAGLEPGTKYVYSVGGDSLGSSPKSDAKIAKDKSEDEDEDDEEERLLSRDDDGHDPLRSRQYEFWTFPRNIGTEEHPLRYLYIADMGWLHYSDHTAKRMKERIHASNKHDIDNEHHIDFIFMNGDLSYFDGQENHLDSFLRKLGDTIAQVPVIATPGNHEAWFNFSSYKRRFNDHLPSLNSSWPSEGLYYPIRIGSVQFLNLNSEDAQATPQMNYSQVSWLNDTLKSIRSEDATKAPAWTITSLHRPVYCSDAGNIAFFQARLEDTFINYGVDLVQSGHVHDYQRTYPVAHKQVIDNPKGFITKSRYYNALAPVYITNGAAGNIELRGSIAPGDWPVYASRQSIYGYSIITVHGHVKTTVGSEDGHVQVSGVLNQKLYNASNDALLDDFYMIKDMMDLHKNTDSG